MSESWKNRLWSLLLVCTFAVVLSVCNKAMDSSSGGSSSSGTAFADGSTVTISSQALPTISALMICGQSGTVTRTWFSAVYTFNYCDSTDDTSLSGSDYSITLDNIILAGFRPCVQHPSGNDNLQQETFFFCN